jgi:5-formyltetrahydrofolate cyclo-ligase
MAARSQSKVEDARTAIRLAFRSKRQGLSAPQQKEAAQNIVTIAKRLNLFTHCRRVAVYLSQDGELDTTGLIEYLWSKNKEVFLPVLHPFCSGYLIFLRYDRTTMMTLNKFGIAEPKLDVSMLCPVQSLDLIFTPLVAFDEQGNRMGMGGGFYDRTLQNLKQHEHNTNNSSQYPKVIGLAHDVQKTLSLPTQVWDIPLAKILTPSKLYSF